MQGHIWPSLPRYSLHVCFLHPESSKWAYFCSMMHRFWDTAEFMTLKGHARSHVTQFIKIWSTVCLLYPKGPNWAIFPLWGIVYEIQPILICGDLKMTLKGHMWPSLPRYSLHISSYTQGAENQLIVALRSTVSEKQPILICIILRWPWKVTQGHTVTYFAPIYSTYASYTQGAQNQLIFGLWRTVSEIQPILWPWKVTQGHRWPSLPRYGIHMHLTPRGPKMSLFLLYGASFLSCILF